MDQLNFSEPTGPIFCFSYSTWGGFLLVVAWVIILALLCLCSYMDRDNKDSHLDNGDSSNPGDDMGGD